MNIRGLAAAIRARALADTGSGGLFNATPLVKTFTHIWGPPDVFTMPVTSLCPFVTYEVATAEENDGFSTDLIGFDVRFHVFDAVESGADTSLKVLDRIYGDGIAQTTRTPTYGFHRWLPTLSITGDAAAPWESGFMHRISHNSAHERDVFHFIDTYSVALSRVKV